MHTCNLVSQEVDTRGTAVHTHLQQRSKFRASLDCIDSSEPVTCPPDEEKCPFSVFWVHRISDIGKSLRHQSHEKDSSRVASGRCVSLSVSAHHGQGHHQPSLTVLACKMAVCEWQDGEQRVWRVGRTECWMASVSVVRAHYAQPWTGRLWLRKI